MPSQTDDTNKKPGTRLSTGSTIKRDDLEQAISGVVSDLEKTLSLQKIIKIKLST